MFSFVHVHYLAYYYAKLIKLASTISIYSPYPFFSYATPGVLPTLRTNVPPTMVDAGILLQASKAKRPHFLHAVII